MSLALYHCRHGKVEGGLWVNGWGVELRVEKPEPSTIGDEVEQDVVGILWDDLVEHATTVMMRVNNDSS